MVLKPMMAIGTTSVAGDGGRQGSGGRPPSPSFLLGDDDDGIPARRACPDPEEFRAAPPAPRYRHALLARAVVTEVVPRLVLAHRGAGTPAAARPGRGRTPRVRANEVANLAERLLAGDVPGAEAVVGAAQSRGLGLEQICLDLMTPAAQRMGQAWVDDTSDYTDVTLGMWHMQRILRRLDDVFQPQSDAPRGVPRRACIVAVPGATHTFGVDMVAGFLRLAGWEVCNEPVASTTELAGVIRDGRFAVVGLSAGCAADLHALAELIGLVRRAAGRRQPVGVMIGGSILGNADGRRDALRIGADAVAVDASHAVRQAEGLLALVVNRA